MGLLITRDDIDKNVYDDVNRTLDVIKEKGVIVMRIDGSSKYLLVSWDLQYSYNYTFDYEIMRCDINELLNMRKYYVMKNPGHDININDYVLFKMYTLFPNDVLIAIPNVIMMKNNCSCMNGLKKYMLMCSIMIDDIVYLIFDSLILIELINYYKNEYHKNMLGIEYRSSHDELMKFDHVFKNWLMMWKKVKL